MVHESAEAIANALQKHSPKAGQLVGVEGFMGSGKTTLSFDLAERLGGIRVGLDSYAQPEADAVAYVGTIRLPHLSRDLKNLLAKFPFVVFEGICLRDALEQLDLEADTTVYVKRVSKVGLWHDGFHLDDFKQAINVPKNWLKVNELVYHVRWQPHEDSDYVYERLEA